MGCFRKPPTPGHGTPADRPGSDLDGDHTDIAQPACAGRGRAVIRFPLLTGRPTEARLASDV